MLLSTAGVLAVAAVFIVISFWRRAKRGHWMVRFGPFETQAVEDLQGTVDQWTEWWQEEDARRTELEERVEQSDRLLNELNERYQAALVQIGQLRACRRYSADVSPSDHELLARVEKQLRENEAALRAARDESRQLKVNVERTARVARHALEQLRVAAR